MNSLEGKKDSQVSLTLIKCLDRLAQYVFKYNLRMHESDGFVRGLYKVCDDLEKLRSSTVLAVISREGDTKKIDDINKSVTRLLELFWASSSYIFYELGTLLTTFAICTVGKSHRRHHSAERYSVWC